jgi:predicted XRE-type DNA-binding protein
MKDAEKIETVEGSGNAFRDFSYPDADLRQAKCLLAAEILRVLDARGWSTRKAQEATGIHYSDIARIRRADLARFTLDRLMTVLNKLGHEVQIEVSVRPRTLPGAPPATQG